MLIKKIELNNFRQFKGKYEIKFACDAEKNITMILGENGAGKTTLAQAFLWVLYGHTQFKDKKVVNKKIIDDAEVGENINVRVDLIIEEEGEEFTITRTQNFEKKINKVSEEQANLQITRKVDGKIKFLENIECKHFIDNMLPYELSRFFFFDGERIKIMSDEIEKGKSKEFANAVRNLVGLNAIMNAIEHLKDSRGNSTVIGRYNKKIDDSSSEEVKKINKQIDDNYEKLNRLQNEIKPLGENIEYYQKESAKLEEEILSFAPAESMKKEYDQLGIAIRNQQNERINLIKGYFNFFNNQGRAFFLAPVIEKSIKELKATDKVDKGIPHVHADTIKYLMKKGTCLCGNKIEPASEEAVTLTKLLEYLPPKSIGTLINQNIKKSEMNLKLSKDFYGSMERNIKLIRTNENAINKNINKQTNLYNKIVDLSSLQSKKDKKSEYDKNIRNFKFSLQEKNRLIGSLTNEIEKLKTKKEQYINIDKNNKKYQLYREYAKELVRVLSADYDEAENFTRNKLEEKINRIFKDIYNGGLSLSLDENYNIKVAVNELDEQIDDIERSTAQNYSVLFAFIAGIIEMAKERSEDSNSGIFDNAVGYPLVMDAPLSAFDKKRINNICDTLPNIAQQVIFFIKDTDGDVAEKHLDKRVGSKYSIIKESELISNIKER